MDQLNYIEVAINFLRFHSSKKDDKYTSVYSDLKNIYASDILNHDVFTEIILKRISER